VRYYLDEDLSQQVAIIGRARGLDIVSSHELGRDKLPDTEQLLLAAQEGRCFVTRNRNDFIRHTNLFHDTGWPHAGVLVVPYSLPNNRYTAIVEALIAYDRSREFGVSPYTLEFLSRAS
jgi:hypothetical protein